jgi:acyl-CoA synthetase (AMP-forming)/AMP-acid ligase II
MSSAAPDPLARLAEVRAQLTGPRGTFEIVEEDVRGLRLPVFKNRSRSLRDLLDASASYGNRDYLVADGQRITYAEHAAAVTSLARALADEYGVKQGDRVAILAANCPEWIVSFWAATCLGAITVGWNAWWSHREVRYALDHSAPRVVITDAERAALLGDLDVPVLTIEDDIPRLMAADRTASLPVLEIDEDEPAVIVYTSGTSGHPKGAVHSHRNLLAVIDYHRLNDAFLAALGMPPTQPRRFLMSLPLFHIASLHNLALPRLATSDTIVVDAGRFDADRVLRLVERERITNWAIVPTMAHRLVELGDLSRYDLSSVTALSVNSAPSSAALKQRLREAIPAVRDALADSYGLTESCTAATVAGAADLAAFPTTVGRAIATVSIEIRDPDGHELPDGTEGEICLRSHFNMLGYWRDDAATATSFAPDAWLRTGDIGYLKDGLLYMSTRRSDLILRGGENVYPAEVEAVLDEHLDVVECLVFGVDDADLGQRVAAVVVVSDGVEVGAEALGKFAADRLAYYKVPAEWQLTTALLPRTATGKLLRRAQSAPDSSAH